ncbi:MarP family serine protease [Candidatus Saccharibacteria bacterium]|nr:MarP family serine protease [Candidatus Saccharibacteria bacterium]
MHINIADVVIFFLCIGALLRGYQIGLIRQLSSTVAFVLGLFPGTIASSWVMSHISGPTQPLAGLSIILAVCFIFMTIGELVAVRLKFAVRNHVVQKIDDSAGALMSVVTLLLGFWLAAALFTLAPPSTIQAQLKNSSILSAVSRKLPPAASILGALNKLVDPNQAPEVFTGREPSPSATYKLPDSTTASAMLNRVRGSVVKIEGLGCGGIVDGSGFVYSPGLVVTNAHVVAGVVSPKVRDERKTYNTSVVLFDPSNDMAVLRATDLAAPSLPLNTAEAEPGSSAYALGFPGGGEYTVSPAVVLESFNALGQDIYGKYRTTRSVYSLQTTVVRGNSGGPVVNDDGQVIGVVFATSTTYNNIGYALTAKQVAGKLALAQQATKAVDTGQCSE